MTGPAGKGSFSIKPPFEVKLLSLSGNVLDGKLEHMAKDRLPCPVRASFLLEFAETLAMAGAERLFGKSPRTAISSSLNILGAADVADLTGRCTLTSGIGGFIVGEVEIRDGKAKRIASAVLSLAASTPHKDDKEVDLDTSIRLAEPISPEATDTPAIRRHQIFEAAKRIIIDKGFDRATMREIADAAGLRIPTMYQYFKNKDDLLVVIFDTYLAHMESDLRAAIRDKATATEQISAAISATLANFDRHRKEILLMTQETKSLRPEIRSAVIAKLLRYLDIFSTILSKGVETGEFRDINPQLYGNLIPMMCQVWAQRHWSVGRFGLDELEKAVLELTLLGIGSNSRAADAD